MCGRYNLGHFDYKIFLLTFNALGQNFIRIPRKEKFLKNSLQEAKAYEGPKKFFILREVEIIQNGTFSTKLSKIISTHLSFSSW